MKIVKRSRDKIKIVKEEVEQMIDHFCEYLTGKIRKAMPEVDDERAEIIQYGIQLLLGELPKIAFVFIIAFALKIGWLTIFAFCVMLPYRSSSGGFHLTTHLGCICMTTALYVGSVLLAQYTYLPNEWVKYGIAIGIWILGMVMCRLYAPADTQWQPIISKKERKKKQILSYITLTVTLIVAVVIPDRVLSNIILYEMFFQSLCITRFAYKLARNEYGHEIYEKEQSLAVNS